MENFTGKQMLIRENFCVGGIRTWAEKFREIDEIFEDLLGQCGIWGEKLEV